MKRSYITPTLILLTLTLLSGLALASTSVSADDVVDNVTITVPMSCTMSGNGMTSHTASIPNGTYNSSIGETTMKAFCNDHEGFAIYAIGYTDEEDGKNVLTSSALGSTSDITTSTATSGNNSAWAMKLAIPQSPTPTYPMTIQSDTEGSFSSFHTVPDDYTLVAKRTSSTDIGQNAEGSSLTTTYQAYISQTQPAGTYTGKVKYIMVHPSTAPAPVGAGKVGVTYHANGSTFTGGGTTNNVVYANSPMYIAANPLIAKTSNIDNEGNQSGSYPTGTTLTPITATGADKMKVVIRYGLSSDTFFPVIEGEYSGQGEPARYEMLQGPATGTATYTFNGDAVTFFMMANSAPTATDGQDYGYFAEVYPVYITEQSGTEASDEFASIAADTGTYATTTDWYGSWYGDINGKHYDFMNEAEVTSFLSENISTLSGITIDLYRGLTFTEAYTRANKSQDGGYYKQQELTKSMCNTIAITQNQTLKDVRDNNTYMVGKLKDGNCWMLDNLALDPTDATTAQNMNESNTNATAAAINNLLNGGSSTTGWSNTAVANVTTNFSNNSYIQPRINNASKNTLVTSYGPASTNGQAKVGIYYNFCAASASTYCYASGQGIDVPGTIIDADQDICPANWRMPTGGDNSGEYYTLAQKYGSDATNTNSLQYNLSTSLSGFYIDISASRQGSYGEWWSSTYFDSEVVESMYTLGVDSTQVFLSSYGRESGQPMRCLISEQRSA